jgi:hypothetical protein
MRHTPGKDGNKVSVSGKNSLLILRSLCGMSVRTAIAFWAMALHKRLAYRLGRGNAKAKLLTKKVVECEVIMR